MPYNFGEMPEKKNENNMNFVKKILNYIYEHSKLIDLISWSCCKLMIFNH